MDCPHRKETSTVIHCHLVDIGTPVGGDPCLECVNEWVDGKVPTLETLTPTLTKMRSKFDGTPAVREPRKLPPFGVRVMTALLAFTRFVKSGGVLLDDAAKAERRKICDGCDKQISYLWMPACEVCGCWLDAKTALPHERCPKLLWPGDKDQPPCGKPCGT